MRSESQEPAVGIDADGRELRRAVRVVQRNDLDSTGLRCGCEADSKRRRRGQDGHSN